MKLGPKQASIIGAVVGHELVRDMQRRLSEIELGREDSFPDAWLESLSEAMSYHHEENWSLLTSSVFNHFSRYFS